MKWVREQIAKGWGAGGRRWRRLRGWRRSLRRWRWRARWLAHRAGERGVGPILLAIGIATVIGVGAALVFDPEWLTGTQSGGQAGNESRSATIRNVGLVGGGLIAILIAYWRSRLAQQDLLNKRYQESAEMLGSSVLSVRLAGIYALQRLAEDHPWEYHIEVMKSLCAFVRNPTEDKVLTRIFEERIKTEALLSRPHPKPELREDVQAALDGIGACHERQATLEAAEKFWLDLHGADLKGAKLTGRKLASAPWLDGKMGSLANVFSYRSGPDFSGAKLHSAKLDWADLSGAHFSGAELNDAYFLSTVLTGAEFTRPSAKHLTQFQLDIAYADPEKPPKLDGLKDARTGEQLEWRGRKPDGQPHPDYPDGPYA